MEAFRGGASNEYVKSVQFMLGSCVSTVFELPVVPCHCFPQKGYCSVVRLSHSIIKIKAKFYCGTRLNILSTFSYFTVISKIIKTIKVVFESDIDIESNFGG